MRPETAILVASNAMTASKKSHRISFSSNLKSATQITLKSVFILTLTAILVASEVNVIPGLHVFELADVIEWLHPATVDPVEGPDAAVRVDRHCGGEGHGGSECSSGSTSSRYGGDCEHSQKHSCFEPQPSHMSRRTEVLQHTLPN